MEPGQIRRGQKRAFLMASLQLLLELFLLVSAWKPLACLDSISALDIGPQIPHNGSVPLIIDVHVFVSNVFDVDILEYTVSSSMLLKLSWLDPSLSWHEDTNPRSFITLPSHLLWTPDFTIREALWVDWREHNPRARVSREGFIELYLSLTTKTNCDFELLRFPSDKSDCSLSFHAFSNTAQELQFHPHAVNEIFSVKRDYMVRGLKAQVPHFQVAPCFQLTLSLENTAVKTTMALVVPGVAILLADICGSLLPLKTTERISYKVTLLLSYLVFHSSLVQTLPSSSSCNPLLISYFTSLLILLSVSTIETVLMSALLARGNFSPKISPNLAPREEGLDTANPGPRSEGEGAATQRAASSLSVSLTEPQRKAEEPGKTWAEAMDHIFLLTYVIITGCSQIIFVIVWVWWECKSDLPPAMDAPYGGKPNF
ncbi:ligand-gated cation channel ZACN isoform X1 [Phascolarctos cinereus]|uniref:Zinc-activated ligand-gated ion channel isoform X2 n=1 Tax=Phascolarctos cinereus TaxID=38626 RepID=A0A6P5LIU8_PHACI|nr:zinc-activated ligand-gated ion channel isoform X2 [Phascolarctos cinereus]